MNFNPISNKRNICNKNSDNLSCLNFIGILIFGISETILCLITNVKKFPVITRFSTMFSIFYVNFIKIYFRVMA